MGTKPPVRRRKPRKAAKRPAHVKAFGLYCDGMQVKAIAERLGVHTSTVHTWKRAEGWQRLRDEQHDAIRQSVADDTRDAWEKVSRTLIDDTRKMSNRLFKLLGAYVSQATKAFKSAPMDEPPTASDLRQAVDALGMVHDLRLSVGQALNGDAAAQSGAIDVNVGISGLDDDDQANEGSAVGADGAA